MSPRRLAVIVVPFVLVATSCGRPLRFQVTFREAPGLSKGSEVRYLGLRIGEVEKVFILGGKNGSPPQIAVRVAIKNREVQIRRDDNFSLGAQGLIGDEVLDITPGPLNAPLITDGSTVQGQIATLPADRLKSVADAYGLAARLDALPREKREQILKTFNRLLDDAIKGSQGLPGRGRETGPNR